MNLQKQAFRVLRCIPFDHSNKWEVGEDFVVASASRDGKSTNLVSKGYLGKPHTPCCPDVNQTISSRLAPLRRAA